MATTAIDISGKFHVMVTAAEISTRPVMIYRDGKRTSEPETDKDGRPLYTLQGLAPVAYGQLFATGTVRTTEKIPAPVSVQIGKVIACEGLFSVRPVMNKYELTGTLTLSHGQSLLAKKAD